MASAVSVDIAHSLGSVCTAYKSEDTSQSCLRRSWRIHANARESSLTCQILSFQIQVSLRVGVVSQPQKKAESRAKCGDYGRRRGSWGAKILCQAQDQSQRFTSYVDPNSGEPSPRLGQIEYPSPMWRGEDAGQMAASSRATLPRGNVKYESRERSRGRGRRRNIVQEEEKELPRWEGDSDDEDEGDLDSGDDQPSQPEQEKDDSPYDIKASWPRGEPLRGNYPLLGEDGSVNAQQDELWWNFQKDKAPQTAWQKRVGDPDTVMASAMAKTGQIKLYGDKPTIAEATLARARKHALKDERLQLEELRRKEVGSMEYYREWVKEWREDTSKETVQIRVQEGVPVHEQLIQMLSVQTQREYYIMQGTDPRIQRDPLTMRMSDEDSKEVYGGDPVYPTINYEQDPKAIIDYRGPSFHEPTPDILDLLRQTGRLKTKAEVMAILAAEAATENQLIGPTDMEGAVDIGEDEEEDVVASDDD